MKKQSITSISLAIITFFAVAETQASVKTPDAAKPVQSNNRIVKAKNRIADQYIVVLKDEVAKWDLEGKANELAGIFGGEIRFYFKDAFKGFSVNMSERAAAALSRHPLVEFVEENGEDTPSAGTQTPTPNWGIDRIDQFSLPLNNTYNYPNDGTNVHVFVIDTGINYTHLEFQRANGTSRVDVANSISYVNDGYGVGDCTGHGTGVASIAGGKYSGVAKNVILHSVRIGNCGALASTENKINALNWVAGRMERPAVVNYSWNNTRPGGFDAIGQAAQGVILSGITLVNSAGNDNIDAANSTPSYLPAVITVGATDIVDRRSSWTFPGSTIVHQSNYGSVIDLFAPGIGVKIAGVGSNNAVQTMYGTSFAAPHVAGAAALYLQTNPFATPAQVQSYIVNRAAPGKVRNVPGGTTQSLLYVY